MPLAGLGEQTIEPGIVLAPEGELARKAAPRAAGLERGPLTERLRALRVGQSTFEPGKTSKQVSHNICTAKRGGRWFKAKTEVAGTRIWRYE